MPYASRGLVFGLIGCASDSQSIEPQSSQYGAEPAAQPKTSESNCPVLASRSWHAWLDAIPGGGGKRLIISGEVDLPTPGYEVSWSEGPADRAMPPSQRFRLVLTPPDGMVAQVVTPTAVKFEGKATYLAYRSIIILCGDKALATISDVTAME